MQKQFHDVDIISITSQPCGSLNLIRLLQTRYESTNWYLPVCHTALGVRFYDIRTKTERFIMDLPAVEKQMSIIDQTNDIFLVHDSTKYYVICPSKRRYYSHSLPTNSTQFHNYCIDKYCTERVICVSEKSVFFWYYQTDAFIPVYSFNTELHFYTVFQTGPKSIIVRNHMNYYVWLRVDLENQTHTEIKEGYYSFLKLKGQNMIIVGAYGYNKVLHLLNTDGQLIRSIKEHQGFFVVTQLECGRVVVGSRNVGLIFVWESDMSKIIKTITVKKGITNIRAFGQGFAAVTGRNVIVWDSQYEIICELSIDLRKLSL